MTAETMPAPEKRPWGLTMTTVWIVGAVIAMMIATVVGILDLVPGRTDGTRPSSPRTPAPSGSSRSWRRPPSSRCWSWRRGSPAGACARLSRAR